MNGRRVSIWFLIGLQLAIFGLIIGLTGLYELYSPPDQTTVLANLHPSIWWGALLLALGLFYTVRFRPQKDL